MSDQIIIADCNYNLSRAERLTATRLVFRGKIKINSIVVTADGAAAECDFYDGVDTNGYLKYKIMAADGDSAVFSPAKPLYFERGLYVVVNATTTHCCIQYEPVDN